MIEIFLEKSIKLVKKSGKDWMVESWIVQNSKKVIKWLKTSWEESIKMQKIEKWLKSEIKIKHKINKKVK